MAMSIETLNKSHVQKFTMLKVIDIFILLFLVKMKVYYKVSIFSRAQYKPKTGMYSMKKKELKEKSVLEGLTILLEKQNMLVFQRQPENTIKMVCREVPERIGLHY